MNPKRGKVGRIGLTGAQGPTGPSGYPIPIGLIVMWHGLIANIPAGWALCNGSGGTPDLRGKFIRGAAAGANPGTTGGSSTHNHSDHAAQTHAGSSVADHAALTHSGMAVANHTTVNSGPIYPNLQQYTSNSVTHSVTQPNQHAAQTHTVTQPSNHAALSHSSETSDPPYYDVVFIQRVS